MATVEELQAQINALMGQLRNAAVTDARERAISWHIKADIDFFMLFIAEYLAFVSLATQLFHGNTTDRGVIQCLKSDDIIRKKYLEEINNNAMLQSNWIIMRDELSNTALTGKAGWWNNSSTDKSKDTQALGNICNLTDWQNMIEILYQIRNNLFHGSKNPNSDRDRILVMSGYYTLRPLVALLIENNTTN